jgi:hypothetical protein
MRDQHEFEYPVDPGNSDSIGWLTIGRLSARARTVRILVLGE